MHGVVSNGLRGVIVLYPRADIVGDLKGNAYREAVRWENITELNMTEWKTV